MCAWLLEEMSVTDLANSYQQFLWQCRSMLLKSRLLCVCDGGGCL